MTTKLELSQLLAARNTELADARLRISVLEGELALRPRLLPETTKRLSELAQEGVGKVPSSFAIRCQVARALAKATGLAVRV